MIALRLARSAAALKTALPATATGASAQRVRCLATATADLASSGNTSATSASSSSRGAPIPVSNIEAQWEKLSGEEKLSVHEQLELLQQKDWKELSLDEKKAAYYVAFGPHGPRTPTSKPGDSLKIFLATMGLVGVSGVLYLVLKQFGQPLPKTMTKEWQEATNERAIEAKINAISGISSEGYSGKGFVTSK